MVSVLKAEQVPVLQFKFDQRRPDLTKIDGLLGMLSAESTHFQQQSNLLANGLRSGTSLRSMVATIKKTTLQIKQMRSAKDNITLHFVIHYITKPGEYLHIAGSLAELGRWNVNQSQQLTWSNDGFWTCELNLRRSSLPFEYKYFVMNAVTKQILWEPNQNRLLNQPNLTEIKDKWGVLY